MSHHADELPPELAAQLSEMFNEQVFKTQFGATGKYPEGKLAKEDEGEIQFGVASDPRRGLVHVDFGKPVQWLAMTAKQAADLGQMLNEKARDADQGRTT